MKSKEQRQRHQQSQYPPANNANESPSRPSTSLSINEQLKRFLTGGPSQQTSPKRSMSLPRRTADGRGGAEQQTFVRRDASRRSLSGTDLSELERVARERQALEQYYEADNRRQFQTMPHRPLQASTSAYTNAQVNTNSLPQGAAAPESYGSSAAASGANNFKRQGRYRKSAMGSFRKWIRNRLRSSKSIDSIKSAPSSSQVGYDGYRPSSHLVRQQAMVDSDSFHPIVPKMPPNYAPSANNRSSNNNQIDQYPQAAPPANRVPPLSSQRPAQPASGDKPVEWPPPTTVTALGDRRGGGDSGMESGVETPSTGIWDPSPPPPQTSASSVPVPLPTPLLSGIANHGNTCYVNAVIQCLANTDPLADYLVSESFLGDLQDGRNSRRYGTEGAVTKAVAEFMQTLWFNQYREEVSRRFKSLIGQYSTEYRTAFQQDAQEFVMWLLDKVHEDLNTATQRKYKPTVKSKGYSSEEDIAGDYLYKHTKAHFSRITQLFVGQLRSAVWCPACEKTKLNFDPYMCISLPLPQQSSSKPIFVTMVYWNRRPRLLKLGLNADITATIKDVKGCLSKEAKVEYDHLLLCSLSSSCSGGAGFETVLADATSVSVLPAGTTLFAVELPQSPYVLPSSSSSGAGSPSPTDVLPVSPPPSQLTHDLALVLLVCKQGETRQSAPFTLRADREISYSELCRGMMKAITPKLRKDVRYHEVPMDAFRIKLDDFTKCSYLVNDGTMPLFTLDVDVALSYQSKEQPQHLRMILEFDSASYSRYCISSDESILEHSSAADLKEEIAETNRYSLLDCLKMYTAKEDLEWKCEFCKRKQWNATKSLQFWSLPDLIIVHLKRFKQTDSGEQVKLDHLINFPLRGLDLTSFTHQPGTTPVSMRRHTAVNGQQKSQNGSGKNGYWTTGRRSRHGSGSKYNSDTNITSSQSQPNSLSNSASNHNGGRSSPYNHNNNLQHTIYDLYAVCNHHGENLNSGHYTAYCRNPLDGIWRGFDDKNVKILKESQIATSSAYLLFYERRGFNRRTTMTLSEKSSTESGFTDHWFHHVAPELVASYLGVQPLAPPPRQPLDEPVPLPPCAPSNGTATNERSYVNWPNDRDKSAVAPRQSAPVSAVPLCNGEAQPPPPPAHQQVIVPKLVQNSAIAPPVVFRQQGPPSTPQSRTKSAAAVNQSQQDDNYDERRKIKTCSSKETDL